MKSENSKKNKYASSNDNYLQKVKTMLVKIIEKIKDNNTFKFSLKNNPNFDCQLLFKEMDPIQKQYINSQDFIEFFKKFSINLNEQIIRRLIQQYDKHSHFKLIYDDFTTLIFGQNRIGLEKGNNNALSNDTVSLFYKILKNEFDLIFMVNELILDIRNCDNFITYEAFISIANNGKSIDKNLMKSFLEDKFDYKDIYYLIYYLDTNNDGKPDLNIDINGFSGPNILGRDIFYYRVASDGKVYPVGSLDSNLAIEGHLVYYWKNDPSACGTSNTIHQEHASYSSTTDISSAGGSGCSARIMENGWVMDY